MGYYVMGGELYLKNGQPSGRNNVCVSGYNAGKPNYALSNFQSNTNSKMYEFNDIHMGKVEFPTSEHFLHFQKLTPAGKNALYKDWQNKTPGQILQEIKHVNASFQKYSASDPSKPNWGAWDKDKIQVQMQINLAKYNQSQEFRDSVQKAIDIGNGFGDGKGPATIIEDTSSAKHLENKWGIGPDGTGTNILGNSQTAFAKMIQEAQEQGLKGKDLDKYISDKINNDAELNKYYQEAENQYKNGVQKALISLKGQLSADDQKMDLSDLPTNMVEEYTSGPNLTVVSGSKKEDKEISSALQAIIDTYESMAKNGTSYKQGFSSPQKNNNSVSFKFPDQKSATEFLQDVAKNNKEGNINVKNAAGEVIARIEGNKLKIYDGKGKFIDADKESKLPSNGMAEADVEKMFESAETAAAPKEVEDGPEPLLATASTAKAAISEIQPKEAPRSILKAAASPSKGQNVQFKSNEEHAVQAENTAGASTYPKDIPRKQVSSEVRAAQMQVKQHSRNQQARHVFFAQLGMMAKQGELKFKSAEELCNKAGALIDKMKEDASDKVSGEHKKLIEKEFNEFKAGVNSEIQKANLGDFLTSELQTFLDKNFNAHLDDGESRLYAKKPFDTDDALDIQQEIDSKLELIVNHFINSVDSKPTTADTASISSAMSAPKNTKEMGNPDLGLVNVGSKLQAPSATSSSMSAPGSKPDENKDVLIEPRMGG